MCRRLLCWSAVFGLLLGVTVAGVAAAQPDQEAPEQTSERRESPERGEQPPPENESLERVAKAGSDVHYEPPRRGAPRAKLGGGLRFAALGPRVTIHALAPDHVAHTLSKSPVLFWFVDPLPDATTPIVFTLLDETGVDPVLETRLPRPDRPGIQAIDLGALGVELEAGTEYEWFVAVVVDRRDRSRDRLGRGYLRYVGDDPELASIPAKATPAELASAGLWYDALQTISAEIDAHPEAPELKAQRTALLDQAGFEIYER